MIDDGARVLARVERGGLVESVHAGHAIALAADGTVRVRVGGFTAAMPDGRALAVKVLDGSPRAIPALVGALLRAVGVDSPPADPVLGGGGPGAVVPAF
jgi:L-asparaginase II